MQQELNYNRYLLEERDRMIQVPFTCYGLSLDLLHELFDFIGTWTGNRRSQWRG